MCLLLIFPESAEFCRSKRNLTVALTWLLHNMFHTVTYSGLAWLIIMASGFSGCIYWHFFTVTISCDSSDSLTGYDSLHSSLDHERLLFCCDELRAANLCSHIGTHWTTSDECSLKNLSRTKSPGQNKLPCGPNSYHHVLRRGHTEETGNRKATAISENCYQPDLNTCYWMEQRRLRKRQRSCNRNLRWSIQ
jgi:hypothetical protein